MVSNEKLGVRPAYAIDPLSALMLKSRTDGLQIRYISYQNDFGSINYTFHDVGFQDAICLVFIMAWSREGADRIDLYAYGNDDQLVQIVADNCRRTIVLYEPALVYILFGDYNPGGKLVFTLAKNDSDFGTDISPMGDTNYTEGVFLDYRQFDRYNITPRYHFEYGLSYTTFAFARLDISPSSIQSTMDGSFRYIYSMDINICQ